MTRSNRKPMSSRRRESRSIRLAGCSLQTRCASMAPKTNSSPQVRNVAAQTGSTTQIALTTSHPVPHVAASGTDDVVRVRGGEHLVAAMTMGDNVQLNLA